jgi:hypothetical protein
MDVDDVLLFVEEDFKMGHKHVLGLPVTAPWLISDGIQAFLRKTP